MKSDPADPAKKRFLAISLLRFSGVALVMLGLGITFGKVDLPPLLGPVFSILGMFDMFVMPVILSRRWKSPK